MRILVLGGFLGSGKTTLLLRLARFYAGKGYQVAIIENEIGNTGIDNQTIQSTGMKIENLFSNCICCSGAAELVSTIKAIQQDHSPDIVLVEATGLSIPSNIRENLVRYGFGTQLRMLVLVDALRFLRLMRATPDILLSQLEQADLLLINKVDASDREQLDRIREIIHEKESTQILEISAASSMSGKEIAYIAGETE